MSAEQAPATGQEPEQSPDQSRTEAKQEEIAATYGAGIAISVMKDGLGLVAVACPEGLGSEVYYYETR